MNAEPGANAALGQRRILIVEDELLLAMELSRLLKQEGFMVIGPAKNVAQAMTLLDSQTPEAVILDINLGGEKSTPVAVELRARGIPFIVASGYGEKRADEPALQDAMWFNKPIRDDRLLRVLADMLTPDAG
jgi:DNA-binding response OmpR family regulator